MLERTAYSTLLDWKQNNNGKVLLIDGARQIGKTYLIEQFARSEYSNWIKIDFLENSSAAQAFAQVQNTQQAIEMLSLLTGKPIENGTLVFFDDLERDAGQRAAHAVRIHDDGLLFGHPVTSHRKKFEKKAAFRKNQQKAVQQITPVPHFTADSVCTVFCLGGSRAAVKGGLLHILYPMPRVL